MSDVKSDKNHFEMCHADKPEEIIAATQRSIISAMKDVVADLKKISGAPGMTWDQIEYLFDKFEKKTPRIIMQEEPI